MIFKTPVIAALCSPKITPCSAYTVLIAATPDLISATSERISRKSCNVRFSASPLITPRFHALYITPKHDACNLAQSLCAGVSSVIGHA